jgi:hypothetical protein
MFAIGADRIEPAHTTEAPAPARDAHYSESRPTRNVRASATISGAAAAG